MMNFQAISVLGFVCFLFFAPFFLLLFSNWDFLVFLSVLSSYTEVTFSKNPPRSHEETVTSLSLLYMGTQTQKDKEHSHQVTAAQSTVKYQ